VQHRSVAAERDELVGRPGHGRDHDRDLVAGPDLARHVPGGMADALQIGDRRPPELHDQS
jgi:hypothetical protein